MSNRIINVARDDAGYSGRFDPVAQTFEMTDPSGKVIKMDLGPSNVRVDAIMQQFAQKYSNGEMAADKAFPVLPVDKASNKYFSLDPSNAFGTVNGTEDAAGAAVPEISLDLSTNSYSTTPRGLGAFVPAEVQTNADLPLDVQVQTLEAVLTRLSLMRELRCKRTLFTTSAWSASNYIDLTGVANSKWNGGSASDPVGVIKTGARACLEYPTHMLMARDTWDAFVQNAQVQKYPAFKSSIAPIPTNATAEQWCAMLDLPKPIIVESKYNSGASYPYVWTADVVLLKMTGMVGKYSHDTCKTFRWLGAGTSPDASLGGTYNNGIFVRSFFNPYRGRYGGQQIIVAHDDAEVITSPLNGYYIKGALQ